MDKFMRNAGGPGPGTAHKRRCLPSRLASTVVGLNLPAAIARMTSMVIEVDAGGQVDALCGC